jgi:hypothetical protein
MAKTWISIWMVSLVSMTPLPRRDRLLLTGSALDDDDDCDYDDSYPEPTMGRRYLQLRSDPSRSPRATEGDFGRRTPEWSSSSWEPPALTDSDSSSIASSVGPPSPQLQPSWPRWEPHPKRTGEPVRRDSQGKTSVLSESEHGSSPSSLPPSRSDHQRQEEFQDVRDTNSH